MPRSIRKQQLSPANPASYSFLLAIDQPAMLLTERGCLVEINDRARLSMGLVGKKIKTNTLPQMLSKSGYALSCVEAESPLRHGKTLFVSNKNTGAAGNIEFKCIETISSHNKPNGYLLMGKCRPAAAVTDFDNTQVTQLRQQTVALDAIPCGVFLKDLKGRAKDSTLAVRGAACLCFHMVLL